MLSLIVNHTFYIPCPDSCPRGPIQRKSIHNKVVSNKYVHKHFKYFINCNSKTGDLFAYSPMHNWTTLQQPENERINSKFPEVTSRKPDIYNRFTFPCYWPLIPSGPKQLKEKLCTFYDEPFLTSFLMLSQPH